MSLYQYIGIFILLIAIWLIWSRYSTNKKISKALILVKEDYPIRIELGLREILGYCNRNKLEFDYLSSKKTIILVFENKVITIVGEGDFRLGSCILIIQKD